MRLGKPTTINLLYALVLVFLYYRLFFSIRLNAHDSEFQSRYLVELMGKIPLRLLKEKGVRGLDSYRP